MKQLVKTINLPLSWEPLVMIATEMRTGSWYLFNFQTYSRSRSRGEFGGRGAQSMTAWIRMAVFAATRATLGEPRLINRNPLVAEIAMKADVSPFGGIVGVIISTGG